MATKHLVINPACKPMLDEIAGITNAADLIPEVWAHTTRDSILANLMSWNLISHIGMPMPRPLQVAFKDSWRRFKAVFTRNPEPYAKFEYLPPNS